QSWTTATRTTRGPAGPPRQESSGIKAAPSSHQRRAAITSGIGSPGIVSCMVRQNARQGAGPYSARSDCGSSSLAARGTVMLARVRSGALRGIDALVVDVEVDVSTGLPHTTTVGLP